MRNHVLVIDDDPVMLANITLMLESWDLDVTQAGSGEEGLRMIRSVPVDVVISDVRMPGMNGNEVLREIQKETAPPPVILITAHGSISNAVNAIHDGAFDYATKPPKEEALRISVRRAIKYHSLQRENMYLKSEIGSAGIGSGRILGESPQMLKIFELVRKVARSDSTVLITGETGTGKELVAQTIHRESSRRDRPLITCNCAAIHGNLLESELFGHERGAFTGAIAMRRGKFEEADGGTLFLDEIGETSADFQAKLLRALQEGEIERVGSNQKIQVDTRILASTNRDVREEVEKGNFREDLYYRLRVVPIHIPPLRERREDILPLASHFVQHYRKMFDGAPQGLSDSAADYLMQQDWRGNVRELQHRIERAIVLASGDELTTEDLTLDAEHESETSHTDLSLQDHIDAETLRHVVATLDQTSWKKKEAAKRLGIDRATLYRILKKHDIEKNASAR